MSVSIGLHRWDRFPEKNGPWMGWRMARLRKMEWLALAGPHSLALSGADPAFKRFPQRPRLGVHQVGEGSAPQA